jgi:hypothetical protein
MLAIPSVALRHPDICQRIPNLTVQHHHQDRQAFRHRQKKEENPCSGADGAQDDSWPHIARKCLQNGVKVQGKFRASLR